MPSRIEELLSSQLAELRTRLLTEYSAELKREVDEHIRQVDDHNRQLVLQVATLRAENEQLREQLALPARSRSETSETFSNCKEESDMVLKHADAKAKQQVDEYTLQSLDPAWAPSGPGNLDMVTYADQIKSPNGHPMPPPVPEARPLSVVPSPAADPPGLIFADDQSEGPLSRRSVASWESSLHSRELSPPTPKKIRRTIMSMSPEGASGGTGDRPWLEGFMSQQSSASSIGKAHRPQFRQGTGETLGEVPEGGMQMARSRRHNPGRVVTMRSISSLGPSEERSPKSVVKISERSQHEENDKNDEPDFGATGSKEGSDGSRDLDDFYFIVWPVWTAEKEKLLWASSCKSSRCFLRTNTSEKPKEDTGEADDSDSEGGDDLEVVKQKVAHSRWARCLQRVTLLPSSPTRLMWDVIGMLMIGYDFVVVPLQFFDPPRTAFIIFMTWLVRWYWTLDFPLSFLTGYNRPEGRVEMRNRQIAVRYCCTWMSFDITLLLFDWLEELTEASGGFGAARIGKMLKSMRLLRMVRLVRLIRVARMPDFMHSIAYHFQSERLQIIAGILRILIFLVGVLHFIACCWYGIGVDVDGDEVSWVRNMDLDKTDLEYQYVTSFHWSLTQFTGTVDINPHNIGERIFAVVTLLFGFVISSSVVSSITSSMTRLQIVSARSHTQTSLLNQYLFENGISAKVALRVQKNAMYALMQEKKNTPESAIELLDLVSEPLRVELHYEIHLPVLTWHPFFRRFNEVNANAMRRICHVAVSRLGVCRGDILFSTGEQPQVCLMYFIMHGRMQYATDGESGSALKPEEKWASEAVLWTPWIHLGTLRARSECQLTMLNAGDFQSICVQFRTQEFYPKMYAEEFCMELNDCTHKEEITDLYPGFDVEQVCSKIFPEHGKEGEHKEKDHTLFNRINSDTSSRGR